MYGTQNLALVLRMQDELRRDAAKHRLATRTAPKETTKAPARRVFGLRLSLA
jgi:hypothetical protein